MTITIVITGSASERSASAGSSQSFRGKPPEGSTPHPSANTQTSTTPTQNTGTATPSCAKPGERDAVPAVGLHGGGDADHERDEQRDGEGDEGERERHSEAIGDVGSDGTELRNDSPRSRRSSCVAHVVNCCSRGWSEPTWWRAAAICSGVAFTESSALAGLPL